MDSDTLYINASRVFIVYYHIDISSQIEQLHQSQYSIVSLINCIDISYNMKSNDISNAFKNSIRIYIYSTTDHL